MTNEKKIYRAGKDHMISGVCAGVADYLNADVTLVRILWLIGSLVNGLGILAYIICMIIIPENPEHVALPKEEKKRSQNTGLIVGIGLVAIGCMFAIGMLVHNVFFFDNWHFHWPGFTVWPFEMEHLLPILLIVFGIWYIYHHSTKKQNSSKEDKKMTTKEFKRSKTKKMIAGVCGGLADYWNIDPSIVRIGYAILTLATALWFGIVAYVIMALVIPEEDDVTVIEETDSE